MSAGEVAGFIAALAFVVLVGLLALPIRKLTSTLEEARRSIERLTDEALPTLRSTATTVEAVNVNLKKAEGVTAGASDVTANVSALTGLLTATLGGPLVKVSSFSYGVRRALAHRRAVDTRQLATRPPGERRRGERRTGRHDSRNVATP